MRRTIDLDQIRVIQADNYKGNPRVYLEIMDTRVLYSSPQELAHSELSYLVADDGTVDTEALADLFRARLAAWLADALLAGNPELLSAWSRTTDREIDYTKPRLEEEAD